MIVFDFSFGGMMRFLNVAISAIAFSYCANAGDFSWGNCTFPDPQKVAGIGIGIEKAEFRLFSLPKGAARWLLMSWDGPKDGLITVIACDGHTLAKLGLGYFDQAVRGPMVNGKETLEVLYVPETGTGINHQSVALLQFDGNSISVLWNHPSQNIDTFPNGLLGANDDPRLRTTREIYRWEYEKNGTGIRVTGLRTTELGRAKRTQKLPSEHWCFQPTTRKFEACKAN
jgi:hypothetical protein